MRYILIITIWSMAVIGSAQTVFPSFLEGTWKMENKNTYEHWDRLNENTLKGFSYSLSGEAMTVTEYLDITNRDNRIVYSASVLRQNNGDGISFILTKSGTSFTFENPNHDFPRKIVYQILNDSKLMVTVSDGNEKGFTYIIEKQGEDQIIKDSTSSNPNYDIALARKLGADDYGMKSYILVLLKTGPNKTTDNTFIDKCFSGHLDNMDKLVKEGKLIVAGPVGKNNNNYRGIFILNLTSVEEAEKLMQTDPAIKEGLLDTEVYNWYGSAALSEYLKYSEKIWKNKPN